MLELKLTREDLTQRGHFTVLVGVLTLYMFVLTPILRFVPLLEFVLDLSFLFVLGWSCYTVSDRRRTFVRGISLAILALVAGVLALAFQMHAMRLVSLACSGLFSAYMAFAILNRVLRGREATLDSIFGGICAYLFFGLLWAFVYAFINAVDPNAFNISSALITQPDSPIRPNALFVYFSFVTLTTLGYGDMSPLSESARALAILEAIAGPFYMAVLIGWLVGQARGFSKPTSDSDA